AERRAPSRRLARFLVQRWYLWAGHLLALHQHPRFRARTHLARAFDRDCARRDHGLVSRVARLRRGSLAAEDRTVALAGGDSCGVAAHRVVAGLVPVRVRVAVAWLLANGYVACRSGAGAGCVWTQRDSAGQRRRTGLSGNDAQMAAGADRD